MALSDAERQRRYYQRQKEKAKEQLRKSEGKHFYLKRPFSEYDDVHGERIDYENTLDLAGIAAPTFYDEAPPQSASGNLGYEGEFYKEIDGSIGRAEMTVGLLLEAAKVLAQMINQYKYEEINDRLKELVQIGGDDETIATLYRYRDQLGKDVRFTLPQWKVKGE